MRTHHVVASLALAAIVTGCNRQDTPTAAQARVAQPSSPAPDLAVAPLPYQRMRFVSPLEQTRSVAPLHATVHARAAARVMAERRRAVSSTPVSLATRLTNAPVAMSVASAAASAPTVVVAASQVAPPMTMPAVEGSEGASERSSGMGGRVGVMIRGGVGPNGKCDPRSDAQAAGMLAGRPNSAMPVMPSVSVFGRR